MQIRWESASNKQKNILVNHHQGTRCFDTRPTAGAAEESEERSQLLKGFEVVFLCIVAHLHLNKSCITFPSQRDIDKQQKRNICHVSGKKIVYYTEIMCSFIVLSQYNKSLNIICTIWVFKSAIKTTVKVTLYSHIINFISLRSFHHQLTLKYYTFVSKVIAEHSSCLQSLE